jgi:hypothetical protein
MLPRKRQRIAEIGRVRVTAAIAAAAAPATAPAVAAGVESEPVSDADLREAQTVKRIEEHLTQIFKRDREQSAKVQARSGQQRPSLQIKLLPTHMTVEGLNLALPYSQENQRLLRTLEQGRVPWDELRRHPELHDLRARAGARCARSRE